MRSRRRFRVRVGDHETHAGKPTGDQAAQERRPARPILGRVDVQVQDLPGALGADCRCDNAGHVHDPSPLTDLLGERIEPEIRVGAPVKRPGAERLHRGVELLCHLRDPGLGQALDPERADQALDPSGGNAADVALGHHLDERSLGPPSGLEQPLGEVGPFAQLRDLQRDRARTCVPWPLPITVSPVHALG
jgi:hypothetical protein